MEKSSLQRMGHAHTPGPWKIDEVWGLIMHGKEEVCALHSGNVANARLIAAAPELLELVKTVPISEPTEESDEWLEEAKKVIAKAEGE